MSETHDLWADVKSTIRARIADYSVTLLGHGKGAQRVKENAQAAIDAAIDAARAAEATQHRQEIAAKDETIGRWTQTGLTLMKFFVEFPVMNESDLPEFMWHEVPTLIRSARQAEAKAEARLAAVEAERDQLKAELVGEREAHGRSLVSAVNTSEILHRLISQLRAERDRLKTALERLTVEMAERSPNDHVTLVDEVYQAARAALSGEGTKP